MPGRDIPLITSEIYHVFNRGIAKQPIFFNKRDYRRFMETTFYYQNKDPSVRFSKFLVLSLDERKRMLDNHMKQHSYLVEFISFCLMPNHFHILIKQLTDNGIARFIGNISNSYTKYFNTKNKRTGPLLQGKFKAVRVEDDEQLLHVTRYIHLNPFTGYVVKDIPALLSYPYSSLREYLKLTNTNLMVKDQVLSHFKTLKSLEEFTLDQADYQRRLGDIKHMIIENE